MTINDDKNFQNPWDEDGNDNKKRKDDGDIDDIIRKGQEKIVNFLNAHGANRHKKSSEKGTGNGNGNGVFSMPMKKILVIGVILVLLAWVSTGFYTIQPDQEGVVMRFGKYNRLSTPGLNYKIPAPFETVTILSVTSVNKEEIGFRSNVTGSVMKEKSVKKNSSVPKESHMLTGDENIIDINFDVQWRIKDAKKFLFNVRDLVGENTVRNTAESAMREIIGLVSIGDALAEERNKIELDAKNLLQTILDSYDMGIEILRLQMLKVEPPPEVLDAYRDVQSSKADREREINQAYALRNEIIPKARGEAQRLTQEAEGYKKQVIADAEGKSNRFNSIYSQYTNAKDITKKRMYIEAMEEILTGMNKVIIDSKDSNGVIPLLPLDKLTPQNKAATDNQ